MLVATFKNISGYYLFYNWSTKTGLSKKISRSISPQLVEGGTSLVEVALSTSNLKHVI